MSFPSLSEENNDLVDEVSYFYLLYIVVGEWAGPIYMMATMAFFIYLAIKFGTVEHIPDKHDKQ